MPGTAIAPTTRNPTPAPQPEHPREQRARPHIALRPLAMPPEHGAWGIMLEPIVLGLLLAPSIAGLLIGLGALLAFLARHPLSLAAQDWRRGRRFPRTRSCEILAGTYAASAIAAFAGAFALAGARPLALLAAVSPLIVVQLIHDFRRQSRHLLPEILGALGASALAASVAIAGGMTFAAALPFSLLAAARTIPSILFVRSALRGEGRAGVLISHGVATLTVLALVLNDALPWGAVAACLMLTVRAIAGAPGNVSAKGLGLREVFYGVATVLLVAFVA